MSKATFTSLLWTFLAYILRPTFVAIIGNTVLSWKYQSLVLVVDESILLYIIIRLRIILHPYSYKGYFRVNREIISHMNQTQNEEDAMAVDQVPFRANQAEFTPIPGEGVHNREAGITWWE